MNYLGLLVYKPVKVGRPVKRLTELAAILEYKGIVITIHKDRELGKFVASERFSGAKLGGSNYYGNTTIDEAIKYAKGAIDKYRDAIITKSKEVVHLTNTGTTYLKLLKCRLR